MGTMVLTSLVVAGLVTAALLYAAHATPSFNIVSATVLARASFLDPIDLKFAINPGNEEVIQVSGAQDTVMQQIVIRPGGHMKHNIISLRPVGFGLLTLLTLVWIAAIQTAWTARLSKPWFHF